MKKINVIIVLSLLTALLLMYPSTSYAQLSDCSLSPGNAFEYKTSEGITQVYEEAVNTNLRPPNILAQKRYRWVPPFTVSQVEVLRNETNNKAFVRAIFSPVLPNEKLLLQYIKNEKNPFVQAANLKPACLEGYSLKYFFGTFQDENMNTSMNNSFSVYFEVPLDYVSTVQVDLEAGRGIELRLQVLMKYACNSQFDINGSYDAISTVVRDFKQETSFNGVNYDITGYNEYEMKNVIKRQIIGKVIIDCEANQNTTRAFDGLTKSLLETGIERIVTFDLLEKENSLIDVNGSQYSPDVMRSLAVDAIEVSDRTFKNRWEQELVRKKIKSGGGNVGFKGFTLGGKGAKTKDSTDKNVSDKEFKERWENTFKYEWGGEKWVPKGFKVYDNVTLKSADEIKGEIDVQQLNKELRFIKPFIITKSK